MLKLITCLILLFIGYPFEANAARYCGAKGDWRSRYIPDKLLGFVNFGKACKEHDACYSSIERRKSDCDQEFLRTMRKECRKRFGSWDPNPLRVECYNIADTYYTAVDRMGGDAWRAAQARAEEEQE